MAEIEIGPPEDPFRAYQRERSLLLLEVTSRINPRSIVDVEQAIYNLVAFNFETGGFAPFPRATTLTELNRRYNKNVKDLRPDMTVKGVITGMVRNRILTVVKWRRSQLIVPTLAYEKYMAQFDDAQVRIQVEKSVFDGAFEP